MSRQKASLEKSFAIGPMAGSRLRGLRPRVGVKRATSASTAIRAELGARRQIDGVDQCHRVVEHPLERRPEADGVLDLKGGTEHAPPAVDVSDPLPSRAIGCRHRRLRWSVRRSGSRSV